MQRRGSLVPRPPGAFRVRGGLGTFSVRAVVLGTVLFALLSASSVTVAPAFAQSLVAMNASAKSTIVLVFDPERHEAEATVRAIQSHLSGAGVVVVEEPIGPSGDLLAWLDLAQSRARAHDALGVFAIDAGNGTELRVFFSEPDGEATLVRRFRNMPGRPRVALEEAGIVVRSIVEALRDGGYVGIVEPRREPADVPDGVDSSETAQAAPAVNDALAEDNGSPPAEGLFDNPSNVRRSARFALALSAIGSSWAADEGWQLGAALGLQMRLTEVFLAQLEYSWFSELRVTRDETTFSIARHPIAVSLRYTPFAGLSPLLQAGAFVDLVSRRTDSTAASLRRTGGDTRWMWGFGARIGLTTSSTRFLRLRVTGGLDVPTTEVDYVVEGDGTRTLLSARSVRPQIEASVEADLW